MRATRPKTRASNRENVVTIDSDSAPRIMFAGERFLLEDLPIGTRVIYPKRPMTPVANPKAAIRYALSHPEDMEPLHALLQPGMKVTIAVDDISMPLPIMRTPDVRQLVLEIVCEMLAEHGVDDVHIIIALALHRRMHDWEIKRMVGQKVWDEFWPDRLYNHDACDPDGMVVLGKTRHGEIVEMNRRAAESRPLVIYVNINLVPMDGGHKSDGRGPVRLREPQGPPHAQGDRRLQLVHGSARARALSHSVDRHRPRRASSTSRSSTSRPWSTTAPSDGQLDVPDEERGRLHRGRPAQVPGHEVVARSSMPYAMRAASSSCARPRPTSWSPATRAPAEPAHAKILDQELRAVLRSRCEGQADILITGIPYISSVQRELQGPEPAARAGAWRSATTITCTEEQAAAPGRRRDDHRAPVLGSLRSRAPPVATSSSSTGILHRDHGRVHARAPSTRTSSRTTRATSRCTAAATPTTARTPSTCGTGASAAARRSRRVIVVGSDNTTVPSMHGLGDAPRLDVRGHRHGRARTMGRSGADHHDAPPAHPDHRRGVSPGD